MLGYQRPSWQIDAVNKTLVLVRVSKSWLPKNTVLQPSLSRFLNVPGVQDGFELAQGDDSRSSRRPTAVSGRRWTILRSRSARFRHCGFFPMIVFVPVEFLPDRAAVLTVEHSASEKLQVSSSTVRLRPPQPENGLGQLAG